MAWCLIKTESPQTKLNNTAARVTEKGYVEIYQIIINVGKISTLVQLTSNSSSGGYSAWIPKEGFCIVNSIIISDRQRSNPVRLDLFPPSSQKKKNVKLRFQVMHWSL